MLSNRKPSTPPTNIAVLRNIVSVWSSSANPAQCTFTKCMRVHITYEQSTIIIPSVGEA